MFISLIYDKKNKNITYLTKPFEQKITKRFTGSKKAVEELGKKCIGAGCPSTRPFMTYAHTPKKEISHNVLQRSSNDNSSEVKSDVTEQTPLKGKFLAHNYVAAPLTKEAENMPKAAVANIPGESCKEKLDKKLPLNYDQMKTEEQAETPVKVLEEQTENATKIAKQDNNNVAKNFEVEELTVENYTKVLGEFVAVIKFNKIYHEDDADSLKPSTVKHQKFYELFNTSKFNKEDPESLAILKNLENYGFITYDQANYIKVTEKLYTNNSYKKQLETIQIDIDSLKDSELTLEICILVINIENTVIASGIQKHAVVTIPLSDDKKIIMGFLTSDKTDIVLLADKMKILLSPTQPFDEISGKGQMFALLKEPLIVYSSDTKELPQPFKQNAIEYLNNPEVFPILKDNAENYIFEKIAKNNYSISVYDGNGFTKEELYVILEEEEKKMKANVETHIKKYKELQFKNKNKIPFWLNNIKAVSSKKYIELLEAAIEEEDKNEKK